MKLPIEAPEGVRFHLVLAGPVTRFLAWLIDALVVIGLILVALMQLAPLLGLWSQDLYVAAVIAGSFGITFGYRIVCEWLLRGRSVGKIALGLRVMDEGGLPLSFGQILIRNLLRAVDSLPGAYLVGGMSVFLTRHCQRLGDLAARTVVVSERDVAVPDFRQGLRSKYNSMKEHARLSAKLRQSLSAEEAGLALESLLRRDEIEEESRLRLFRRLREEFESRVSFPQEATVGLTDEQYVRNVVEILFDKQAG